MSQFSYFFRAVHRKRRHHHHLDSPSAGGGFSLHMVAKRESRSREESLSSEREKIQQLCHMLHKGPKLLPERHEQYIFHL